MKKRQGNTICYVLFMSGSLIYRTGGEGWGRGGEGLGRGGEGKNGKGWIGEVSLWKMGTNYERYVLTVLTLHM